ncbi:MAG: hypothetical protein JWQ29_1212, partial [Phenylobacterium sp.]|nr:hypothetical protein [Phenylobacterium sp.]
MGEALHEGRESAARIECLRDWAGDRACERELTSETVRQYIFIHSGSGRVELAGASHSLMPGAHVAIPAGVTARIWLDPGVSGILLAATETFLRSRVLPVLFVPSPDHWRRYGVPNVVIRCEGEANRPVRDRMQQELEQAAERLGGLCDAAVIAYAFVIMGSDRPAATILEPPPEIPAGDLAPAQLVMRFHEAIEQSFRHHLTIEDYAQQLAVTPVRLARACKSTMDRTPLSLVHERVIVEAK